MCRDDSTTEAEHTPDGKGFRLAVSISTHGRPSWKVHPTMRTIVISAVAAAALVPVSPVDAASTSFDPRIVTFGESRQQIQSTPILERPYRPLHVYGNTVRRRHTRGAR